MRPCGSIVRPWPGLGLKATFSGLGLGLGMWGLGMWGLGLACQRLVNNVLPLKLSSCMSHDAFDCTVFQLCYRLNLLTIYLLCKLGFMPSFANLRPWFYPLKCEALALALKTSGLGLGLGLVLAGLGLGLGLEDLWPWPWPCIAWPWSWPWHCWPC